jgi:hypothetical protein
MRCLVRRLVCATIASAPFFFQPAYAAHRTDCRKGAFEALQASAQDGASVYQRMTDKSFFTHWIDCHEDQFGLSTAVHESVHFITADIDAYPLVDGGDIKRPHEVSRFYAPSRLAASFKDDAYVTTYLKKGSATSASDFMYLLDELNAYTHDLNAAIDLKSLTRPNETNDHRDGLAALMAFVALYIERAQSDDPTTWAGLQKPEVAKTVTELWGHAEKVMSASCGIPNFGTEDKSYIRKFCEPKAQASLQTILGRAPECPTACLKADPVDADATDEEDQATTPPDPSTRTIWSHQKARRTSASDNPGKGGGSTQD